MIRYCKFQKARRIMNIMDFNFTSWTDHKNVLWDDLEIEKKKIIKIKTKMKILSKTKTEI